jgi:hypothetical protein
MRGICRRESTYFMVSATTVSFNRIRRARATADTSSMHCSSKDRVSGMVRIIPIGAVLTAPTPPNAVTSKNFSHKALCMSAGISAFTLESLTKWILTQMSQDLVRVRKASFSAEARLRADNRCTERFELSNTTSATLD